MKAPLFILALAYWIPQACADEITGFTVDFSNGGPPLSYTTADGSLTYQPWGAYPHSATFEFFGNVTGEFASLYFSAPGNLELTPGLYTDVARFPFQAPDQAGLWIAVNGSGPNTVTGQFTVLEAVYNADGTIAHFGASYEEFPDGFSPPWIGNVYYNFDQPSVPEPSSFVCLAIPALLIASGVRHHARQPS
jgi:hypothetical protein